MRNPRFSKDITVKPEFLSQSSSSPSKSDLSDTSLLQLVSPSSSQTSNSSPSPRKKSHKKTASRIQRSQIHKSSFNDGISRSEDVLINNASTKDLLAKDYSIVEDVSIRDSLNEVASLFSKPKLSTLRPLINQKPSINASTFSSKDQSPIVPLKPIQNIKSRSETAQARSQDASKFEVLSDSSTCLGSHIARRLVEIGVTDIFTVPGDFNLILLDHLIAQPGLNNIGCCNEINAGYAADGYARCRGVGACVVTFTVGGLSVINAIAGSYSENLPIICLVGGPNSNDYGTNRILHHTIGIPDFSQEVRCFQQVTCYQVFFPFTFEQSNHLLH